MNLSKTVRLFLLDGEPTGTRVIEISNWIGLCYLIPRIRLSQTLSVQNNIDDLDSQCVYFLVGETEEGEKSVYVGEAENFIQRVKQHDRDKDFWNTAICFTSKDENLTKSHVKYLESRLTEQIRYVSTYQLENGNVPPRPKLPRAEVAEMDEFFNNLRMVLSSIGLTFLERDEQTENDDKFLFYCKGAGVEARGVFAEEGFLIFEGSTVRGGVVPSISRGIDERRRKAIQDGSLEQLPNGDYKVVKKLRLGSPSHAASFVLGSSVNGQTKWKNKRGMTLKTVFMG